MESVSRSDLSFDDDLFGTRDSCAMHQCPGVVLALSKRRWHLELADVWERHDESNHVGRVKINRIACGEIIIWKKVSAVEKLYCFFNDLFGDPFIQTLEFFTGLCVLFLLNRGGWLMTF